MERLKKYATEFIKPPFWEHLDSHKNEPGVLICNGPSLDDVPDEFLNKYPTMGSNSIYTKDGIIVDYYFIEGRGHLMMPQERLARIPYMMEVAGQGGYNFVNRRFIQFFDFIPNVYTIDYINHNNRAETVFQFEPFVNHGTGWCVTYAMFQFAHYFGFNPLLIIGMDHRFVEGQWHFYKDAEAPEFVSMPYNEYENFRKKVDPVFEEVSKVFKYTDREILNLTPDSAAWMFEVDDLENWL